MTPILEAPGESTSKTPAPNELGSGSIFDEAKEKLMAMSENLNVDYNLKTEETSDFNASRASNFKDELEQLELSPSKSKQHLLGTAMMKCIVGVNKKTKVSSIFTTGDI